MDDKEFIKTQLEDLQSKNNEQREIIAQLAAKIEKLEAQGQQKAFFSLLFNWSSEKSVVQRFSEAAAVFLLSVGVVYGVYKVWAAISGKLFFDVVSKELKKKLRYRDFVNDVAVNPTTLENNERFIVLLDTIIALAGASKVVTVKDFVKRLELVKDYLVKQNLELSEKINAKLNQPILRDSSSSISKSDSSADSDNSE